MKEVTINLYEETDGDYSALYQLLIRDTETSVDLCLKESWRKINRIPDQYWGPPIGLVERLQDDPNIETCSVCGFKIYVSGTMAIQALWDDGSCRVCDAIKRNNSSR